MPLSHLIELRYTLEIIIMSTLGIYSITKFKLFIFKEVLVYQLIYKYEQLPLSTRALNYTVIRVILRLNETEFAYYFINC